MAGATAAAATNIGDKGSGVMAVSSDCTCLVSGRWRRGNGGGNGEAVAAVSAPTVDGSNRPVEVA